MKRDELLAKAKEFIVPTSLLSDIVPAQEGPVIARAEGNHSYNTEGNSYLDFNSGQICSNFGHDNPRIQKVDGRERAKCSAGGLRASTYYNAS